MNGYIGDKKSYLISKNKLLNFIRLIEDIQTGNYVIIDWYISQFVLYLIDIFNTLYHYITLYIPM